MSDLDERFRTLKSLPAPELWEQIERREPRAAPPPPGRLPVAAVALLLAAGGLVVAGRALLSESPRPGQTTRTGDIAFTVRLSGLEDGHDQIWLMNPAGGNARMLLEGRDPAWSPDGTQLAFRRGDPNQGGGLPTRIFVADADGTDVRSIEPDTRYGEASGEAGPPVWSPDGRRIAFDTLGGIYVMSPDGDGLRLVTRYEGDQSCVDLQPSWSPDGRRLVFAVLCDGGNEGLWVVNLDGSARTQLLAPGKDLSDLTEPAWSPDGSRIAFAGAYPLGGGEFGSHVYVMNANGTGIRQLTQGSGLYATPRWSPDGRSLLIVDLTAEDSVYSMDADGTNVRRLTDPSVDACCPWWQPHPRDEEQSDTKERPSPSDARVAETRSLRGANAVVVEGGNVWVQVVGHDRDCGGDLLRFDAATGEQMASIPVEGVAGWEIGGGGITATADAVWVLGNVCPRDGPMAVILQRIDPASNRVADVFELGPGRAADIAVSETGVWMMLVRPSEHDDAAEILRFDPAADQVIARISLPAGAAREVLADDVATWAWILERSQNGTVVGHGTLEKIDPATDRVISSLDLDVHSPGLGELGLWAAHECSLVQIDPRGGSVVEEAAVGQPSFQLLDQGGGGIWFFGQRCDGRGRPRLVRFNPDTNEVDVSLALPEDVSPIDLAVGDESVWVVGYEGSLTRIELR